MLRSLDDTAPERPLEADVVVIGAGLAGLFLAEGLVRKGCRVLVLESGDSEQTDDPHLLNAVEMAGTTYAGAEFGRFRGLGGTTSRWGGALLPYLEIDLGPHPCGWHNGWGISLGELDAALPKVEAIFGVIPGTYEGDRDEAALLPNFVPRLPKWPAFRQRNTANIFADRIRNDSNFLVWTGATVTKINLGSHRLEGVLAKSFSGNTLEARAPRVVLAAGAIETTRLLLLLRRLHSGKLFLANSPLGRGFHDHLSASIADLKSVDSKSIARFFGFSFVPGGMRNLRFELAPDFRRREGLPAAFLHVAFTRDEKSGFEGLRKVYQAMQKRHLPSAADFGQILSDAPWFARAVWWRAFKKRVLPPPASQFELHLVIEQEPAEGRCVALSDTQVDAFGLPLARIDWDVSQSDLASFQRIADLSVASWREGGVGKLARLAPRPHAELRRTVETGGGIFHPAGTTRIGPTPATGVVDKNLNVHGVPGLRALATSVFPSVGGSSPSLALVQLALRLADDIAREVRADG